MLQICKIHQIPLLLRLLIPAHKLTGQDKQLLHRRGAASHGCLNFLLREGSVLVSAFYCRLFHPVADRGHLLLLFRVNLLFPGRRKAAEGKGLQAGLKGFKIPGLADGLQHIPLIPQIRKIPCRAVRLLADGHGLLHLGDKFRHLHPHISKEKLYPAALRKFLRRSKLLAALLQPFLRPGMAHCEPVHLLHRLLDSLIRLPAAVGFHKTDKFRGGLLVLILKKLPHHIRPQKSQLPLVTHPEGRVDVQTGVMASDQRKTEAVYGLNLGMGY